MMTVRWGPSLVSDWSTKHTCSIGAPYGRLIRCERLCKWWPLVGGRAGGQSTECPLHFPPKRLSYYTSETDHFGLFQLLFVGIQKTLGVKFDPISMFLWIFIWKFGDKTFKVFRWLIFSHHSNCCVPKRALEIQFLTFLLSWSVLSKVNGSSGSDWQRCRLKKT